MKSNMKNKKTPATTTKKKSLPGATSRSRRKAAREMTRGTQSKDGLYLLSDANIASDTPAMPSTSSNSLPVDVSNHTLMAFLQRLDDSNRQIMCRMDDLERQGAVNSTHVQSPSVSARLVTIDDRPRIHTHNQRERAVIDPANSSDPFTAQSLSTAQESTGHHRAKRHILSDPEITHTGRPGFIRQSDLDPFPAPNAHLNRAAFRSTDDSTVGHPTMPTIDALRKMPTVNDAVTQLLSHYERGNGQELIQGKPVSKRSGRYNNTDTSILQPQFRWPNEGYTGGAAKKRTAYDDLSVPQWVAGQLTNAIQIQDNDVLRSVLSQIIFTMRDATSIPWPAAREAYASSMHEVEEGRLAWSDATQWALNRLSASQITLVNSRT